MRLAPGMPLLNSSSPKWFTEEGQLYYYLHLDCAVVLLSNLLHLSPVGVANCNKGN